MNRSTELKIIFMHVAIQLAALIYVFIGFYRKDFPTLLNIFVITIQILSIADIVWYINRVFPKQERA